MSLTSRAAVLAAALCCCFASGCAPKCEDIPSSATSVCRHADAGAIAPNTPFVVQGQTSTRTACQVSVDGGLINLSFTASNCSSANGAAEFADPVAPAFLPCEVPALAAGTYSFNTGTTFTIPESADAGLPVCP